MRVERDTVLNGIHIGEHSFIPEKIKEEIYDRVIRPGYNFVTIRPARNIDLNPKYFVEWAEYLAENKVYFVFLYTIQNAPKEKESYLDKETVSEIKKVAGKYFVGDMIGETGSSVACKWPGYYEKSVENWDSKIGTRKHPDMKSAHDAYVKEVSKLVALDRELGIPDVVSVEATGLNKYNAEAGVTIPMLELMCGSPEILVSSLRGMARAFDAKMWGTYLAHEWYGGMRHDDPLKRKRLELAYKYAYMAGSQAFCLESGDEVIASYGHRFEYDSDICMDYRKALDDMKALIESDCRPVGGPKVKFAFVSGLHDAWGSWGSSYVWNQFEGEEWGHGEAEHSWRLLSEIGVKRTWDDIANFGEHDFSMLPAFGMYDIVPIEADVEKLCRYDFLIFLGWNSMTDENMEKITEYVRRGGRLLMSAAHLNYSSKRKGELILPSNDKLETLFGAKFTGETFKATDGVKFDYSSLDEKIYYPGTKSHACDPIYSAGYVEYAKFELAGGKEIAYISDSFIKADGKAPAVIENRLGDGIATLVTAAAYPGNPALYPLYRAIVREMIRASNLVSPNFRVLSSDRLRYAVYDFNRIYLLNTDYDMPITVKIIYGDGDSRERVVTLAPLELKVEKI